MGNLNTLNQIFNISYIQSELREVDLYKGKIDGMFGKGGYDSMDAISKVLGKHKLITRTNSFDAKTIFRNIQSFLLSNGYDPKGVDGLWGNNSKIAYDKFIHDYKHKAGVNHLWYAWTGNNAVFDDGVTKLRKWLIEDNKKPDIHVDYILTIFALITKERFDPSMKGNGTVGLIGFSGLAATSLGTTLDELSSMSFTKQIDYVIKYYSGVINKINTLDDYYAALIAPSKVGNPIEPLQSKVLADTLWKGLDPINRDIIECHVEDLPINEVPKVDNPNIAKPVEKVEGKSGFVFGKASEQRLVGVKPILVKVVRRALELSEVDFGVREGLRTIEQQREYVRKGVSQTMNSKHLTGDAVDLYPTYLPPDWGTNINVFMPVLIAMFKAANEMNVKLRFGVNWKGDPTLSIETKFIDAPHTELAS